MRLIIILLFIGVHSLTGFSQEETVTHLVHSENIEQQSETSEKKIILEHQVLDDSNPAASINGNINNNNYEDEELSDSDQGMSGVIRAVGVACATFVGCIAGVGVTIWLCIKGKKAIESASN